MKGLLVATLLYVGSAAVVGSESSPAFRVEYEHRWSSDRITIQYPDSMTPAGALGSRPIESAALPTLVPVAPCHWYWVSERELGCVLSESDRLQPATAYQLTVPAMTSQSGQPIAGGKHAFETRRPALNNGNVNWTSERIGELSLRFTAAVDADSLQQHLYLRDQKTGERIAPLAIRPDSELEPGTAFIVTLPADLRAGAAYALGFADGIKPLQGQLPLIAHERNNTVLVSGRFGYVGASCVPRESYQRQFTETNRKPTCKPDDGIDLWFTEQLSEDSIEELKTSVAAKQAYSFSTRREQAEQNGEQKLFAVRLQGLPSDQSIDVLLPVMTDQWQRRLQKTRIRFRTSEWQPSLLIDEHPAAIRDREQATLAVHSINARQVELHLEQVTRDGIKNSRHRISVPNFQANAWQQWQLDLHRFLDPRGGILRGLIKTKSGNLLKGFRINYQPDDLLVRRIDNALMVWAIDGQSKQPLTNANLILRNGWDTKTRHAEVQTDASGFASLPLPASGTEDDNKGKKYDTWWLQLDQSNRTSILPLSLNDWDIGDWAADTFRGGYLRVPVGHKLLWGITDRHLYSPGETLHYSFFVRQKTEQQFRCVPEKAGYHLAVFNQDEDIVLRQGPLALDQRCSSAGTLTLPEKLSHGLYHVIVRDHPVTQADFQDSTDSELSFHGRFLFEIANPRPPAINVNATADQPIWRTWLTPLTVKTTASYFSGGPLRNAELSFSGYFLHTESEYGEVHDPREQKYPGYRFELFDTEDRLDALEAPLSPSQTAAADDAGGMTTVIKPDVWLPGYSRFAADVSSVGTDKQTYEGWLDHVTVFHNSEFVGLKLNKRYPKVGDVLETSLQVLDTTYKPVAGKLVTLTLYRHSRPNYGYHSDTSAFSRGDSVAKCQTNSGTESVNCAIKTTEAGSYELVAAIEDSAGRQHEASIWLRVFEAGGWRWADDDEPELLLRADKSDYQIGDTAQIELQQPFAAGRALIQVERNRTLQSFWLEVTESVQQIAVPITADMQNGASVTVLFTPTGTERGNRTLTERVALRVASPSMPTIKLATDKSRYRPGDKVTAAVQLPQPGKRGVVLTAVDSALLKLMYDADNYFNPDNTEFLQSYRSWRVATNVDNRPWISEKTAVEGVSRIDIENAQPVLMLARAAPAPASRSDDFYGDDDEEQRIEVTGSRIRRTDLIGPATDDSAVLPSYSNRKTEHWRARIRQHFRQNAFWLAQGETDANGRLSLQFTLPDNLTGWTLMAVSYDADHEFGFAKSELLAALPIEARINGPEHGIVGDRIGISATVRNAEAGNKTINAKLTVQADGQAPVSNEKRQALPAYGEMLLSKELVTTAVDKKAINVRWLVQAQDAGAEDAVAGEVLLRTPTESRRLQRSVLLQPGVPTPFSFPQPADAFDQQATISWQPLSLLTGVQETADYMQAYPHRCWEQRTSRLWSAVLASRLLAEKAGAKSATTAAAATNAEQQRLLADWLEQASGFQAPNGGFAYWRGEDRHVDLYLSLYTAQAFASFRALGWQDGAEIEQRLLTYLHKQLMRLHQSQDKSSRDDIAEAMLAAAIKEPTSEWLRASSAVNDLAKLGNEALIWWLRALSQTKPDADITTQLRKELLSRGFARNGMVELKAVERDHDWRWLSSTQRAQCLAASVLAQTAVTDADRAEAYGWLRTAQLQREPGGEFGSTQENAYCLQAVADFTTLGPDIKLTPAIRASFNGKPVTMAPSQPLAVQVKADNQLELRSDAVQPQWLTVAVDYHADAKRNRNQQQGFSLQRQYEVFRKDRWQRLDNNALSVGDWVRVTLTVSNHHFEPHVALSDVLPGAWVAVDPEHDATVPVHTLGETNTAWQFYERQFHAGYARFYAEGLHPGRHQIQYLAKVISHGRYQALPAKVEALYDSSRVGSSEEQMISVGLPN